MSNSESIKSPASARNFGRNLAAQGKTLAQISQALAERGYVSNKTKKPLTQSGMSTLLKLKEARLSRRTKPRQEPKTEGLAALRLRLVRSLCEQKDMRAEDRIAAISLLLEK